MLLVLPGVAGAGDEVPATSSAVRPYSYSAAAASAAKRAHPEWGRSTSEPITQNVTAPEPRGGNRASTVPDWRTSIEQMLQAREFSFSPSHFRPAGKPTDIRASGYADLTGVKLRISRDAVIIRAQFTFN